MQTTKVCRKPVNLGGNTTVLDLECLQQAHRKKGASACTVHTKNLQNITNMLIRSQPRKDNVTKPIHEKNKAAIGR